MRRTGLGLLLAALAATPAAAAAGPDVPGAEIRALAFATLDGWAADDHAAAFRTFRKTCLDVAESTAEIRSAVPPPEALVAVCLDALALPEALDRAGSRVFFEKGFEPFEIVAPPGRGLLTGYYEPEFEGSLVPTPDFGTPLLAKPDDLVTFGVGESVEGLPPGMIAGRRKPIGVEPYPDRAAIEDGGIDRHTAPVVYLRDGVDAFVIHVQGSARIRLPDGKAVRVAYDGRNGQPYTSVARLVVEKLGIPPAEMTADVLTGWLRAHPAEARDILRTNKSYIFFRIADELAPTDGPVGAAGVPVSPGRSLAVDRTSWSYGLPVWLDGELPLPGGRREPLKRLLVMQDTGSAIIGPTRGDLFVGSGEEAGRRAGLIREPVRFVVLWPRGVAGAPAKP